MTRIGTRFPMTLFAAALFLAAALLPAGDALAVERGGYSMEILIGGRPVDEYAARGTTYVEALRRREYSVRLRNRTAERIAIALSVDGLNSIDARTTTARDARKWILGPYETITLDGWQVSSDTARRFFFTTEDKSYGNWLGKTKNLGLVAAAVFREKRPPISIYGVPRYNEPRYGDSRLQRGEGRSRGDESNSAPAPAEPSAPMADPNPTGDTAGSVMGGIAQPKKSDDLAATGIGEETSHPVQQVYFDSEDAPTTVLELRYEYRDSLVRLGVLPPFDPYGDTLSRRERARGFDDSGFSPDPFRRRNR
ncbi:MAG TPA: hypothetical protein VGV60_07445 [Candidatus Polarisedimenticolia bacterium]|jgi:hypothetical protein|nr:hypothetical protein [Candidatus Polarisedimenticolia bacterium]